MVVFAGLFGAAVGSFLNVCVYRWPEGLSVLEPRRSFCPLCRTPIRWYDNLPVIGWLILRGRCRSCAERISPQYPLVELLVAVTWAAAVVLYGFEVEALRAALFLTLLLGIGLTDARHMVIPDQFSLGGAAVGLLLAPLAGGITFRAALIGAVSGYVIFWLVMYLGEKAFRKPALGLGDVHMMAMVGAFVGVGGALLTIMLGSMLGVLIGVPATFARGRLQALGTYLPLGVFLAMAGAITLIWGEAIIGWYLNMVL